MAQLSKTTKSNKLLIEDLDFLGVGQNLNDTSKKTSRQLNVKFLTKKGTELSFKLYNSEVTFIKNEILKWEQEKEYFKKNKNKKIG